MEIRRHSNFKKRYEKLSKALKAKVNLSIEKFFRNPRDPILRNHALNGIMAGKRAISVTGDVRIIFEEYDNYILGNL